MENIAITPDLITESLVGKLVRVVTKAGSVHFGILKYDCQLCSHYVEYNYGGDHRLSHELDWKYLELNE